MRLQVRICDACGGEIPLSWSSAAEHRLQLQLTNIVLDGRYVAAGRPRNKVIDVCEDCDKKPFGEILYKVQDRLLASGMSDA